MNQTVCDGVLGVPRAQRSAGSRLTETVDICITTDYKELEHVCLLADVLAKRKELRLSVCSV